MPNSIALIILALNEESCIRETYETYKKSIEKKGLNYEFIIINDGSSDQTGEISETIKKEDPSVTVFHNNIPMGIGYGFKLGLQHTEKEYCMWTGAYSGLSEKYIDLCFDSIGNTDLTIGHITNPKVRKFFRRNLSSIFTCLMNLITGLNIKYYNALVLCKTSPLKKIKIRSNKYTFQAECITKLIKLKQCTYKEIGLVVGVRKGGDTSRAMKRANFLDTGKFFCLLLYDCYLNPKSQALSNLNIETRSK
jgi:glycosyltransferase involved in cell wall biosynthesis